MKKKANHLAFARPAAPPAPLLAPPAPVLVAPSASALPKSLVGGTQGPPPAKEKKKKKRPSDGGTPPESKAKKPREAGTSPEPTARPSPRPTSAPASAAAVGMDPSHVLLVVSSAAKLTERALQRQFASCAPLQVGLLSDWSTGQPRGVACLAVASARAVELAMRPEMVAGSGLRVCTAATSGATEEGFGATLSVAMRKLVTALEAKVHGAIASPAGATPMLPPRVLRHLLLACDHAAATAAVDEFCAVARSGTPKQPGALLTTGLLRQRRLAGGDLWLGRVNGLPLPVAPAAKLHRLLERLDWSAMPADGKLRGEMAEQSFKLGLSTKAWGKQNGPYVPFAFKAGMGVWDAASVTRRHRELWEAASELISAIDPDYRWTSVQFNKNFRGSRHRDDKDASHQVATAFGSYTGGELRVHGQDGLLDVNTRDRFVRFDGRFEHEVLPYEGLRYSVIYFMLAPPWSVDPSSTEEGVSA